jgi:glutaredoxin
MEPMKQQCYLLNVWFTWLALPALAIVMGVVTGWWAGVIVLLVGVFGQIYYIKIFPQVSRWLGYGSVEDVAADSARQTQPVSKVTLYTASVCPFCSIVKRRLIELQRNLKFELVEVDITFQPGLIREKGIRSVPVIEMDGRYWVGNATSAQLLAFLTKPN